MKRSPGNKISIVIVLFVLVGFIHVLPHIIFHNYSLNKEAYYPMNFSELAYASQVKEITEGHFSIGDSQLYELKNVFPPLYPYIPILILALMSAALGSIGSAFLISDFIFPSLIFLMIYLFSKRVTKNSLFSIFNGLATLFLYSIASNVPPVTPYLLNQLFKKLFILDITSPLPFLRTPNPQITIIFLLIPLFSLYFFILNPTIKKTLIITIFGSLLFSNYFYHATFFYFVVIFVFLLSVFRKQWKQSKYLLLTIIVLTLIALFYKHLSSHIPYSYSQIMAGFFKSRYIDWVFTLRYFSALIIAYFLLRYKNKPLLILSSAIFLSAVVCVNFQLFFGWTISPGHWPQTTIEPVALTLLLIAIHEFISKKISLDKFYIVLSALILVYAVIFQLRFTEKYKNSTVIPKDNISALMWLKDHMNKDSVVLSLDIVNFQSFVTVLTNANNFIPIYDYHYSSIDEIWLRNLYAYKIYGLDIPNIKFESLQPAIYSLDQAFNINKYKHHSLNEYPQEYIAKMQSCFPSTCSGYYVIPKTITAYYKSIYQDLNLDSMPYKLDYVIYGDYEKRLGASPPKGEIVFTSGSTTIYKLSGYLH